MGLVNGVATSVIWPPSRWAKLSNQIPSGRNPFDLTNVKVLDEDDVISDVRDTLSDDLICDVRISDKCDVRNDSIDDEETVSVGVRI